MTTAKLNLLEFMKNARLSVPIYQRPYSWEEKHCKKLLEDIKQAGQPERKTPHFMGSILSVAKTLAAGGNPNTPYTLIDGQQRITTLSLLLIALRDRLGNTPPPRSLLMQTATSSLKSKAKTNTN